MKNSLLTSLLALFLCLPVFAQNQAAGFEKEWAAIDTLLLTKDLPKTALQQVNALYTKARRQQNEAQLVKALVYTLYIHNQVEEPDINRQAALLQAEIDRSLSAVQKSVLQVLLARTYLNYFNRNSWKLNQQRADEIPSAKKDITTWSREDFYTHTVALYQAALQPEQALQQTGLQQYAPMVSGGNAAWLRPSLYDLLAHLALDFYQYPGIEASQAHSFTNIADTAILSPAAWFVQHRFNWPDSTGTSWRAIALFQSLLRFHAQDKDPAAWIDVDLERIAWAATQAATGSRQRLYQQALHQAAITYNGHTGAAQAWYLLAQELVNDAGSYRPFGDTAHRYGIVQARQLIDAHLNPADSLDEGQANLLQLKRMTGRKELFTQVEQVNTPGIPFRLLVRYRNADTLYGRIIRLSYAAAAETVQLREDDWKNKTALQAERQFTQPLPAAGDYQLHQAEVAIDALPPGSYLLLGSTGSGFDSRRDQLAAQYFQVSAISCLQNGTDFFVLNRETGQPLAHIQANLFTHSWNATLGHFVNKPTGKMATDENGYFQAAPTPAPGNNIGLSFFGKADTLDLRNSSLYLPFTNQEPTVKNRRASIYFFTDRSIYRPGQTVFFKGLAITQDSTGKRAVCYQPKDSIRIYLQDANNQKIDSLAFIANAYGSFTGQFHLPPQGLNGRFTLAAAAMNGISEIKMEAYKRPTFYLQFDTLPAAYKLYDSIHLTGQVKNYAGVPLSQATLQFNVTRNGRFPYPWRLEGLYTKPYSGEQQISNGTVTTDAAGKFYLVFTAVPDPSVDRKSAAVFDFTIHAAVTGSNGETREKSTQVSIGYQSVLLQLQLPATMAVADFNTIGITTQTLSGKAVPRNIRLAIYPLQGPERLIRERYWERPDQYTLTESAFVSRFPHDPYANETDYHQWPRNAAILSDTFATTQPAYTLGRTLPPGWYAVEARLYEQGDTITDVQFIQLYNATDQAAAPAVYHWSNVPAGPFLPGQTTNLLLGSPIPRLHLIQYLPGTRQYQYRQLGKGITALPIPLTEEGGSLFYAFVQHNRFYQGGASLPVQHPEQDLKISYASFRNTAEPGSKESWSITVSGSNGQPAAAELLTGMYDASLDQLHEHEWNRPSIWTTTSYYNRWNGNENFQSSSSRGNDLPGYEPGYRKQYPRLLLPDQLWINDENTLPVAPAGRLNPSLRIRGMATMATTSPLYLVDGKIQEKMDVPAANIARTKVVKDETAVALYGARAANGVVIIDTKKEMEQPPQVRGNFNETAFFFPQLLADSSGTYRFNFTLPEAVTQWKWLSFAHTKALALGTASQVVTTQKLLMIQPNLPRFLRNGDQLEISTSISNTSLQAFSGQAHLQLTDPVSGQPVDGLFHNLFPDQYFTVAPGSSSVVRFPLAVPFNYNQPLTLRLTASAGQYTDGEEHELPVLTNRTLVTESLPLQITGNGGHFTFSPLLQQHSETATPQGITVEFTGNPLWYAINALPYLDMPTADCAEELFNALFGNQLAAVIVQQNPAIQAAVRQWQQDTTRLPSTLQQNEALKQVVLQETPWVMDAQDEAQHRKNIARLLDRSQIRQKTNALLEQLQQLQLPGGAFPWFKGGGEEVYITTYLVTGIGRLLALPHLDADLRAPLGSIAAKAIAYLDAVALKHYQQQRQTGRTIPAFSTSAITYLFMRSYFSNIPLKNKTAYTYYYQQARSSWVKQNNYTRAMTGLLLYRNGEQGFVQKNILPSLLQNAVTDSLNGMYWKNRSTHFWYAAPIEHQCMLMELLQEINRRQPAATLSNAIEQMRTWLLLHKQTHDWKTTASTAAACYTLLNSNKALNQPAPAFNIRLGSYQVATDPAQPATGYLKQFIPGNQVVPAMGNIQVSRTTTGPASRAWGAVYWQYFEDNERIASTESPFRVERKLFLEKNNGKEKILYPVQEGDELQTGNKLIVRLELHSNRDLEYVSLKDTRAASMEPVQVLSGYQWQNGLGYYTSTGDASTQFFIDHLPKGSFMLEYPVYLAHAGKFTAGIATLQCQYAPEYTAHSKSIQINVNAPR